MNGIVLAGGAGSRLQPITRGDAYLIGRAAAGLRALVANARGADPMRARRRDVRVRQLGDPNLDPADVLRSCG